MANITPATGMSRSILKLKSRPVYCNISSPSRHLGQTSTTIPENVPHLLGSQSRRVSRLHTSRQFSLGGYGLIPRPKELLGKSRVAGNSKRWLATEGELDTPTDGPTTDGNSPSLRLNNRKTGIHLGRPDSRPPTLLDLHWLRDSCDCSICINPDSGQKNFGTCDVPTELSAQKISKTEDGGLEIVWENDFLTSDHHVSRYPAEVFSATRADMTFLPRLTLWDKAIIKKEQLTINYDQWMDGKDEYLSGLRSLGTHGLLFLRNVPPSEESVVSIANQIGKIQETFYGKTWDVRSKPNAENIAYTNSFLGLHQDLLYMPDPPRIQILHCLENTCAGGESMFSDGARASLQLKLTRNNLWNLLATRKIRYQYDRGGHFYVEDRSVTGSNPNHIYWSPPFQASTQLVTKTRQGQAYYRMWLTAANQFRENLEREEYLYQYKLQPGECVLFDNLRVLHGRRQFDDASGSRWLKGTYISDEVFTQKVGSLRTKLLTRGGGTVTMRDQAFRLNGQHTHWRNRGKQPEQEPHSAEVPVEVPVDVPVEAPGEASAEAVDEKQE